MTCVKCSIWTRKHSATAHPWSKLQCATSKWDMPAGQRRERKIRSPWKGRRGLAGWRQRAEREDGLCRESCFDSRYIFRRSTEIQSFHNEALHQIHKTFAKWGNRLTGSQLKILSLAMAGHNWLTKFESRFQWVSNWSNPRCCPPESTTIWMTTTFAE